MEYIKKVKKYVHDHQAELDKDQRFKDKKKKDNKYKTAFMKLTDVTKMEFFCTRCFNDTVAPAYKVWVSFYEIGLWKSICPECTLPVYRHITEKNSDPYYDNSLKIKEMRAEGEKDMLTPGMYGFKTLYGDPFAHYYAKYQKKDEAIKHKYLSMGLTGETIKERTERDKLKEAFNL